ncbi:MAG: DUF348 domain-containing protein [Chloroflexi bacterium]|nr:DUF348 domain-containing protein [Chloroflexota bacterium]
MEVEADGLLLRGLTQSGSVADALRELGVHLGRDDRLLYGGEPLPVQTLLLDLLADPLDPYQERPAVRLSVERAMPITISDDGVLASLNTYATTVREALRVHNVLWHNTDRITPGLDDPINAGLHILVERSKPMTIIADGKTLPARTRAPTIAQALPEAGIYLKGKDYTLPPASTATRDNMLVQVVRVREDLIEEASPIAYAKLMQPDDNLEIDQQRLAQRGQAGEHRRAIRIVYENGQEIKRTLEREWDARAPVPQITAYGHKIVVRDLMTPGGPIQYWRVIRMYATSYSPSRSGVSPSKSWYGHTFSGLMAGKGVVAIDKSVVPWLADLYVPGYGTAIAGDTGSGIIGKWIDLGYDDDNYESWSQWVNVYLLTPAPPAQFIRWILPNTPVEPRSRQ